MKGYGLVGATCPDGNRAVSRTEDEKRAMA